MLWNISILAALSSFVQTGSVVTYIVNNPLQN